MVTRLVGRVVTDGAGLPPSSIHIVGRLSKKQAVQCDHLSQGYAVHLDTLTAPGNSRYTILSLLKFGGPGVQASTG